MELEREALETTGHMGPRERRALTSPNTLCAYLSPTGEEEKSSLRGPIQLSTAGETG